MDHNIPDNAQEAYNRMQNRPPVRDPETLDLEEAKDLLGEEYYATVMEFASDAFIDEDADEIFEASMTKDDMELGRLANSIRSKLMTRLEDILADAEAVVYEEESEIDTYGEPR